MSHVRLVYPELAQIPKPEVRRKPLKRAASDIFEYLFWSQPWALKTLLRQLATEDQWQDLSYDW